MYIPGSGKNGGKGFADLYFKQGSFTYLWDVKTALHGHDTYKQKQDLDQLERYVNGDENYRSASEFVNDPIPTTPTTFTVIDEKKPGINRKYTVTYQNAGNGLIFYRFDRIKKDDDDEEEDKNRIPYIWDKFNRSESYNQAKDDVIDRSKNRVETTDKRRTCRCNCDCFCSCSWDNCVPPIFS